MLMATIGYLSYPKRTCLSNWKVKQWIWCTLIMGTATFALGLQLWDMDEHLDPAYSKDIDYAKHFTDYSWKAYAANIILLGPGLVIFSVGTALLGMIAPDDIRGLMFSINGILGGAFIVFQTKFASMTSDTNEIITW